MERIQDALEKARQQRELNPPAQSAEAGAAADEVKSQAPKSEPPKQQHGLDDINYSQTKVLSLNAAHLTRHRIVAQNKNDPNTFLFDTLRTQVLQKMEANGWRTLAVISPTPEAGKTVVAINLAISIAQHSERSAMLVDFDLRRPSISNYLGVDVDIERSLNDVLDRTCELPEALLNPGIPRLVVLPAKKSVRGSSELLASRKVDKLVKELRERYEERVVIFDLPPLLGADDAIAVLPKIDCVLMVVGSGLSSKRDVQESLTLLSSANLIGTILNKSREPKRHFYY